MYKQKEKNPPPPKKKNTVNTAGHQHQVITGHPTQYSQTPMVNGHQSSYISGAGIPLTLS
jgi:hypothetical protein